MKTQLIFALLFCFGCSLFARQEGINPNEQGISKMNFFYAGESRALRMYIVKKGKIVWKYENMEPNQGEISDATLMKDGNILVAHQYGIFEINMQHQILWKMHVPENTEIHTIQPIGKNKVVYVQNGVPAKVVIMEIPSLKKLGEFPIETKDFVHGQVRNARLTSRGTLLISHMDGNMVRQYDCEGHVLRQVDLQKSPWSAFELKNGNLLVTGSQFIKELDRNSKEVWSIDFSQNQKYYGITSAQTSRRFKNGNTLINNWFNQWNGAKVDQKNPPVQAIMVSPSKDILYKLCSWSNPDLGPSTIIQPLNEKVDRNQCFFGKFK